LRRLFLSSLPFMTLLMALPLPATITLQLTPSVAQPQLVGTTVTWTASASDTDAGALDYQFSVEAGSKGFVVLQDYDVSNIFSWTPYLQEGNYQVRAIARNLTTNNTASVTIPFGIKSRVSGSTPVISATNHPLVALYSAPACASGSTIYVKFSTGAASNQTTAIPCSTGHSMNFYIGGMYPHTVYSMNYVVVTGSSSTNGPTGQFTTGSIPKGVPFPTISIPIPASSQDSATQGILLLDCYSNPVNTNNLDFVPTATDLKGRVIWYYPGYDSERISFDPLRARPSFCIQPMRTRGCGSSFSVKSIWPVIPFGRPALRGSTSNWRRWGNWPWWGSTTTLRCCPTDTLW